MKQPAHILICGEPGAGKSTLIQRLLGENSRPVYGFVTPKAPAGENGITRVYIHPAEAADRRYTPGNCIGVCGAAYSRGNPEVFDTLGLALLEASPGGILLMDELGFMESKTSLFCARVLEALDGDIPVLAAVKSKDTPFLQKVRSHKNARVYWLTQANRDALYTEIRPAIKTWNGTVKRPCISHTYPPTAAHPGARSSVRRMNGGSPRASHPYSRLPRRQ
jgi:nucleoside-triphosphatase THEP1